MTTSRRSRGFSLIELMVGVAIGLVLTLAIFQVLVTSEGRKRSLTGVNDVSQSGAYSVHTCSTACCSAGTGFAQGLNRQNGPIGCRISARLPVATGETLPRTNRVPCAVHRRSARTAARAGGDLPLDASGRRLRRDHGDERRVGLRRSAVRRAGGQHRRC